MFDKGPLCSACIQRGCCMVSAQRASEARQGRMRGNSRVGCEARVRLGKPLVTKGVFPSHMLQRAPGLQVGMQL